MKYKIEIWQWHDLVEQFADDNILKILEWYKENWQYIYEKDGCTFYVYKNDELLPFDHLYKLGFF